MSRLELTGLYAAGYKLGVAYRICVDSKRCLKAASHEGARLSLVEKEEAEGFFVGGSRWGTAVPRFSLGSPGFH